MLTLLTRPPEDLRHQVLAALHEDAEIRSEVIDLTATGERPDYDRVLEAVFEADVVQVW